MEPSTCTKIFCKINNQSMGSFIDLHHSTRDENKRLKNQRVGVRFRFRLNVCRSTTHIHTESRTTKCFTVISIYLSSYSTSTPEICVTCTTQNSYFVGTPGNLFHSFISVFITNRSLRLTFKPSGSAVPTTNLKDSLTHCLISKFWLNNSWPLIRHLQSCLQLNNRTTRDIYCSSKSINETTHGSRFS